MDNHPIETLMKATMENLRNMIDVNTIVGTPMESTDGSTIIPISKVSFGFASGGSEFCAKNEKKDTNSNYPFGGGAGAGVSLKPAAFLVIKENSVRLMPLDYQNTYDKIIDTAPQIFELIKDSIEKHKDDKDEHATKIHNPDKDFSHSEPTEEKEVD